MGCLDKVWDSFFQPALAVLRVEGCSDLRGALVSPAEQGMLQGKEMQSFLIVIQHLLGRVLGRVSAMVRSQAGHPPESQARHLGAALCWR